MTLNIHFVLQDFKTSMADVILLYHRIIVGNREVRHAGSVSFVTPAGPALHRRTRAPRCRGIKWIASG
jgi:hypothetical protein